jgi:tripartite ATP-independent transporter DctP family solute receptor
MNDCGRSNNCDGGNKMKTKKLVMRFAALTLVIAMALVSAGCGGSDSGDKGDGSIKIIMGLEGGDGLPDAIMGDKFKELVEAKSEGRIEVEYHKNGELGGEDELLQQVMSGSIQASMLSTSTFSEYTNALDALQLPFLYDSYEIERQALVSDEARALYADLEEQNIKILDVCEIGMRHFANKKGPIETMDDLKGKKMRIVPSNIVKDTATCLGMSVTPMSYGELYTGLQQGVIDGEEINLISIVEEKHYEVLEYVSIINLYSFPSALIFNNEFFDGLTEDQQGLLEECSQEAFEYTMDKTEEIEQASFKTIEGEGLKINTVSDAERAKFIEAAKPVYEDYFSKNEKIRAYAEMVQGL